MSADDSAPEQAREVEVLRHWKAEALEVISGLQEVGKALGVGLGERITARATVDRALDLRNERDAAVAEAEELRASIAAERQEAARKGGRQALLDFAARQFEMSQAWGHDAAWLTTGTKVAALVADWAREAAGDLDEQQERRLE